MSSMSRRVAGAAAVPVLALSALAVLPAAPSYAAGVDPVPAAHGADWLAGELTDGVLVGEFGSDVGLTIDAAIALDAVGGHAADLAAIADGVATEVDADNPNYNYVSGEAFGDTGSTYAGAVAKTVVLAQLTDQTLATYGGENFLTRLEGTVSTDPADAGRIHDTSSFGDNANTFGQSFAVRALDAAGSPLTGSATEFLLAQQCTEGFFTQAMGADLASTCDSDEDATPSVDGTALAILNLASQKDDTDVQGAIDAGVAFLEGAQSTDGSWGGNANSTGLATSALGQEGELPEATAGAVWLRTHQADDFGPCTTGLTGETGAVALDDAALADGRTNGLSVASRDLVRRASAQAVLGLLYAPAGTYAAEPTSTSGYVKAGSKQTVEADTLAPGQTVCFARGASQTLVNADADGHAEGKVTLPSGSGTRAYGVGLTDGTYGTITFHALGAKTIPFSLKKQVVAGRKQVVEVKGLAAREHVKVVFVAKSTTLGLATTATKNGTVVLRVPVGPKLGKQTVRVVGEFSNRRASKAFTVVKGR